MPYLVRKVSLSKWQPKFGVIEGEIPADALSADLRTFENALSFWKIESPQDANEIGQVALALIANADKVDRMDLTWIKRESLDSKGIQMNSTEGNTPVKCLKNLHVDVSCLDMVRCSKIASIISESIHCQWIIRFTKKDLLKLITGALRGELLSIEDLNHKVREAVIRFRSAGN